MKKNILNRERIIRIIYAKSVDNSDKGPNAYFIYKF